MSAFADHLPYGSKKRSQPLARSHAFGASNPGWSGGACRSRTGCAIFPGMSTILEADETGALRLPPSLLPHPGPHRRYRVAAEGGQVVVDEVMAESAKDDSGDRRAWLDDLRQSRERNDTGKTGTPLQQVMDELREERI